MRYDDDATRFPDPRTGFRVRDVDGRGAAFGAAFGAGFCAFLGAAFFGAAFFGAAFFAAAFLGPAFCVLPDAARDLRPAPP